MKYHLYQERFNVSRSHRPKSKSGDQRPNRRAKMAKDIALVIFGKQASF